MSSSVRARAIALGLVAVVVAGVVFAASAGGFFESGRFERDLREPGRRGLEWRPERVGRQPLGRVERAERLADPVADPRADAGHGRGPARRAVHDPREGEAPPDRRHDRRPLAGPPPVRLQLRLGRVAGPRRGRHPALHDNLPGEHAARRRRAGPQLALLLHRLGGRVARRLRPRRRLAAGPRDAPRPGPRAARLRRQPVLQRCVFPADHAEGAAAQPVHDRPAAPPAGDQGGRHQGPGRSGLEVRSRRAARRAPGRGSIETDYPTTTSCTSTTGPRTRTSAS